MFSGMKILLNCCLRFWKLKYHDIDHNKRSGNNPIEVRYKAEVEEILDGNRLSLTPKSLDSSLEFDNANIEGDDILFNEVTGRNKRKMSLNSPKKSHEKLIDLKYDRLKVY